ncbi:hypothetical protein, partial [Kingella sp. (in: b-proteobacteria)]|uniref:hypothetical protein n=1 Tax=Kingella sp. (in: b-proteobacteria) TaxID=2020713 RepID=UPI0026DD6C32
GKTVASKRAMVFLNIMNPRKKQKRKGSVLKSMLHYCSCPRWREREQIAEFLPNTACYQP